MWAGECPSRDPHAVSGLPSGSQTLLVFDHRESACRFRSGQILHEYGINSRVLAVTLLVWSSNIMMELQSERGASHTATAESTSMLLCMCLIVQSLSQVSDVDAYACDRRMRGLRT